MTILYVNTGSSPNKGDGDSLRTSFNKINENFRYLSSSTNANTGDITFDGIKIIGAGTASGDGSGYSTLELVPDSSLTGTNQYIIVDPSAPNHIHIRAGGTQDASNAELFFGGDLNNVRVSDSSNSVFISTDNNNSGTQTWTFSSDGSIRVPTMATPAQVTAGTIAWNATEGTFDMGLLNGVAYQAGQETHIYVKAYENITNGQTVMFAGAAGDNILVRLYDPTVLGFRSQWFLGVATQDLLANQFGYITVFGKVRGVDTNLFSVGNILYADNTVPGGLTVTEPAPGNPHITVAVVVKKSGGNGDLMIRPTIRNYLRELPDVSISNPTNGQVLKYNSTGSFWYNVTETATISVSLLKSIVAESTSFEDFQSRISAI